MTYGTAGYLKTIEMPEQRKYIVINDLPGGRVFWDGEKWAAYVGAARRYDSQAKAKEVAKAQGGEARPVAGGR